MTISITAKLPLKFTARRCAVSSDGKAYYMHVTIDGEYFNCGMYDGQQFKLWKGAMDIYPHTIYRF